MPNFIWISLLNLREFINDVDPEGREKGRKSVLIGEHIVLQDQDMYIISTHTISLDDGELLPLGQLMATHTKLLL